MPFLKDDKEAAQHINGLINQYAAGKTAEDLDYNSEFRDLEDIQKSTCGAITELTTNFKGKTQAELSAPHIPHTMSEVSLHVANLDEIVMAKAKFEKHK